MNILVIAPHPDDETIGCGGSLALHSANGDRIAAVFLTSGELGLKHLSLGEARRIREAEAKKAAAILGISRLDFLRLPDWAAGNEIRKGAGLLRPILQRDKPGLLYLPHPNEWHPDHQAASKLLKAALRGSGVKPPACRAYEIWTPLSHYDHVENISAVMPVKLRAIRAHRSQLKEINYARAVTGLNQYRGELAGAGRYKYAEVFSTENS